MTRQLNANEIRDIARTNTTPINIPRSIRQINQIVNTSMPAGKVVPLAAFPLLREDTLRNSMLHCKVDLMETAEMVRNAIQCRFQVWVVPFLAFDRFNGSMDHFNRSYMKQPREPGDLVTPFFLSQAAPAAGAWPVHKYLGFHHKQGDIINTAYIEAYNSIMNFRLRNRSEMLYQAVKRLSTDTSLCPAFWQHQQFKYVVPDWDDKAMEGAVPLTFTQSKLPVFSDNYAAANDKGGISWPATGSGNLQTVSGVGYGFNGKIYSDLANAGVTFSLANLELVKKTVWYAELKAQFEGLPDTWVVDMLMQGINVTDQMWKQPIKIADKTEIFGVEKRWATDGANLTDAVVNGGCICDLDIVLPRIPTGGIVMVTAEILPEQLFERARDPLMYITDPFQLPNAMRDDLDPQKVEVMKNGEVDTAHSNPNGTFGYRPMNWMWQASNTRIGGKWYKTAPDNTFNEERQHFWTVEVANPSLGVDHMIAQTFNQLPFVVTNQDVGEVQIQGTALIEGNTQFGERLLENDNAYAEVLTKIDQSRIVKS